MASKCLNCDQNIEGNFCSNCGQKTSIHRFSIKHFFAHDLLHGLFHIDKGFLFTITELFTRPGNSIREYIQGKRVNHFNYFAAAILIITIDYLFTQWFKIDVTGLLGKENVLGLLRISRHYAKIVIFLGVPFYALTSYLLFRKSKQNFSENLVLNIYMLCGWLLISLLFKILMALIGNEQVLEVLNLVVLVLIYFYVFIFYYQYFSAFGYKKSSLAIRSLAIALLILVIKQEINNILNSIGLMYFH
jgi:presenilin-like A22 family membrane protease